MVAVQILKKTLVCLFFISFTLHCAFAQTKKGMNGSKGNMEQFQTLKKDYLIQQIGMTPQEADKFFPLYDQFQKKKFSLFHDVRLKIREIERSKTPVSDETYQKVSEAINRSQLREAQLTNEYFRQFAKILSPEKLFKYQSAESKFNKEMLKKIRPGDGPRKMER